MHQRQPRHHRSGAALASVLACVAILALAPRVGHAQGQCPTQFQEQTSGTVTDGGTICANAVGNKCTFNLELCANQPEAGCTPQDLKTRTIHAASPTFCAGKIGKVKVKANGTSAVCGSVAGVTVKAKKHGTVARSCKIRGKAKQAKTSITLLCQPQSMPCSGATTTTTTATTTTTLRCTCATSSFHQLSFTTSVGSGNCGTLTTSTGGLLINLACGGLYTGGGSAGVPLPFQVPDMGSSLTGLGPCSGTSLTLTRLTSTDTGSNRNCTSVGCLFGPPLPIPNSTTTPISLCVINSVSADATGSADCVTGASNLSLPLSSELFLAGDLFPNAPGIQSCPVCNQTCNAGTNSGGPCNSDADCPGAGAGSCAGTIKCHGGPNDGMACTPGDSALNPSFPTTHDCPPTATQDIGGLPIGFALSTGTRTETGQALTGPVTAQQRVFCGFCRDIDGAGTTCFEGDPNTPPTTSCPRNNKCTGTMDPFNCCTGVGAGSCDQAPKPCTDSSQCTDGMGTWPNCQQHNPGAFQFGTAKTITETGSAAGDLTDGAGHASTLVSIFCVPPTFNGSVDNTGDLPGPGAVSLPGMAQLQ